MFASHPKLAGILEENQAFPNVIINIIVVIPDLFK